MHARIAISRSYYAAFHHADLWLREQRDKRLEQRDKHKRVWGQLNTDPLAAVRKLSAIGIDLRGAREIADYKVDLSELEYHPAEYLLVARKIITTLDDAA